MFKKKLIILFYYLRNILFYKHLFFKFVNKLKKNKDILSQSEIEQNILKNYKIYNTKEFIEKILRKQFYQFSEYEKERYYNSKKILKDINIKMGGGANIDLLYSLIKNLKFNNIIETGVAYGWSSLSILSALENVKNAKLISIDMPYPNLASVKYIGCLVPKNLKYKWQLIRKSDRSALKNILENNNFNLCHYDSGKSYYGRKWAYNLIWNNLEKKGVLISDDISDNMAFLDFAKFVKVKPIIIKFNSKYIGLIFK